MYIVHVYRISLHIHMYVYRPSNCCSFTALHGMQTRHSDQKAVRLSVGLTREL